MTAADLLMMLAVLDSGARTREDILTGPALPTPHGRSFGGQVLGQALAAAGTTAPEGRMIHSMHGYFLRPGNSSERMTFEVDRLYDGRSFSTRRVQAYQEGQVLMSLISSFQEPDTGLEHQDVIDMSELPDPESLPTVWEKYGHLASNGQASWMLNRPFDFRHVESDITLEVAERTNRQRVWMRSRDTLDAPPMLHAAALAFASDYLLLEPIVRKHGIPWATPGMRFASLDHAMWFHRPFRVDEWLLYELESPTAQGGRGLTHGRFYDRNGVLVASVSQEGMIRTPGSEDSAAE
ncbi:acyl-CoA thioesterase [Leucobacter chromiireducens]|uniref:Acyl-CoA thioesterase II n=1 Tax=Leucobacter chromiireducens subsp. chromiireducens TaxID=660067 RepID=A0ABS1SRJ9_9MICO|nr:acyl-CoA thioesterase II [Leucobacter chromiireducens]MBL3690757.1 acyl-CoA thioesterase II [Leucobacter chromiireducens subsp. chromiireducens]